LELFSASGKVRLKYLIDAMSPIPKLLCI